MSIFQVIAVLFGLLMLYVSHLHYKKKNLSTFEASFWISTWVTFVIVATFPQVLNGLSEQLRFSRVFDLLVVGAFMIITSTVIMSYFKQKETTKKLQHLIQTLAIEKEQSKHEDTKR